MKKKNLVAENQRKKVDMKKIIYSMLIILILIVFTGCSIQDDEESSTEENKFQIVYTYDNDIFEFVDPDTGVHYWIYSHVAGRAGMGGITPRLNSDGTVMVTK